MFTLIVIAVLAVFLFFYVAIPLIFPKQADPLPEEIDPIAAELEEEREALFRAILELEERKDLPVERRDALKARYESKAAQVLRALDERKTKLKGLKVPTAKKQRTFPYAALALLTLMLISAVVMGGYVLPRVGSEASVTTAFTEQLEAGHRLRKLQQAASKNPNLENQLALAEAQWEIGFRFEDDEQVIAAINIYENLASEYSELPATAYFRLGLSQLQNDPDKALANFDKARKLNPNDPEMLVDLAEIYFSFGILEGAIELWQSYLTTPEGADDDAIKERLAIVKSLATKYQAVREDPSEANLMALADTLWSLEQRQLAQSAYLTVIKDHNSGNTLALSRAGQAMFIGGDPKEAVVLLSRAKDLEREQGKQDLSTLLFLGNAYFSLQNYAEAIATWEEYVELAGDEDSAGRVPSLIVQARARLTGNSEEEGEEFASEGQRLYQANCIACHGARGEGSSAISLRNQKLTEARVARIVRDGKGLMPAFEVLLSSEEITAIAKFVAEEIALR